jgi:hypothetical protein
MIWIEWGGRTYGPYASPEAALQAGFHLPDACPCKGCQKLESRRVA